MLAHPCVCLFIILWYSFVDVNFYFILNRPTGFPGGSAGKETACNAGNPGFIPGSGRYPGQGHGNPLQYSCLRNPMYRGAWRSTVHEDKLTNESDMAEWLTHIHKQANMLCNYHPLTRFLKMVQAHKISMDWVFVVGGCGFGTALGLSQCTLL